MSSSRLFLFTALAMLFFAGNSVLCRLAFGHHSIDAGSFTTIRLFSGALTLAILTHIRQITTLRMFGKQYACYAISGNWLSAITLFIYAASFSFAYVGLSTGMGALLLFGAVQTTMILAGLWSGETLNRLQISGILIALAGLVTIMLPSLVVPATMLDVYLMLLAGVAWGVYSLLGRHVFDPTHETFGNFLRATPLAVLLMGMQWSHIHLSEWGILFAVLSGALTSGIGYTVWYAVLPKLTAIRAAAVQLSVPVIAALAGILFLHETMSLTMLLASVALLGGIVLIIGGKYVAK